MQSTLRQITSIDEITLLLIGSFCLLAISRYFFPKRFEQFILLVITNKYFSIQGKNTSLFQAFNIILFIVQVISFSLFIYLFYSTEKSINTLLFFQIALGFSLFTLLKISLEKLVGVIFSIEELINSYLFNKFSYTSLASIVVLFSHFFIFYYFFYNNHIYLMVLSGILSVFILISRLYFYIKHKKLILSNFFYFILYLCTLEISPYYLLYKALF